MNRFSGPGPGEPVSRTDLRELSDGVSNLYDQFALSGINRDDTLGSPMLSVPKAQVLNVRPLSGSDGVYAWEGVIPADLEGNWNSDGTNWGTDGISPLIERNGNALTIGDVVEATLDESLGVWICDVGGGGDELFEVILTDRALVSAGHYQFAWTYPDNSPGGELPIKASLVHTQAATGSIPDIYTLTIYSTAGTFTLTDGSPTSALAWDASAGTIQSALTNYTASGGPGVSGAPGIYTLTGVDNSAHPLTLDATGLTATAFHDPAEYLNVATPMEYGTIHVWLKLKSGGDPVVTPTTKQTGNSIDKRAIITITRANLKDGFVRFRFDGAGSWVKVHWNWDATALQTALSSLLTCTVTSPATDVFEVTVTADYAPHTINVDISALFGTKLYKVVWSNDEASACITRINHITLTDLTGYDPTVQNAMMIDTDGCVIAVPSEDCDA